MVESYQCLLPVTMSEETKTAGELSLFTKHLLELLVKVEENPERTYDVHRKVSDVMSEYDSTPELYPRGKINDHFTFRRQRTKRKTYRVQVCRHACIVAGVQ